jgi:hypothetical protein
MWGWIAKGIPARSPEQLDQGMEALRRHWRTALGYEHVRPRRLFPLSPTERPQLVALDWMD